MAELTALKSEIESRLCEPLPPAEIAELGRQLKSSSDELEQLEVAWLDLSEQLEVATT